MASSARRLARAAARGLAGRPAPTAAPLRIERPDPADVGALFAWALAEGCDVRPHYLWSVFQAAREASALGVPRMSALEFGVAGGNGLLALERAASEAERHYDVAVDVVGFDSGTGMPSPVDHRDVPWVIKPGMLAMDEVKLRARLTRSELVLGPVVETVPRWMATCSAPVGFAVFDLDYYSSTMDAFALFGGPPAVLLPRVVCYFDDVFGYGWSDFNGERAAIADFNGAHEQRKIGKIHGLRYQLPLEHREQPWPEQLYVAHLLDHPRYDDYVGGVSEEFLGGHDLA